MKIREIMTASPAFATPDMDLVQVAKLMEENDCGAIPIVEGGPSGRAIGVVTDRDIAIRGVGHGKDPRSLKAADVMSGSPVTVDENDSVDDAARLMGEHQVRRVIVIDAKGYCCGIVSQADVALHGGKGDTAKLVQQVSEPAGARR